MQTGKWVRQAAVADEPLVILDRGRPTARLMPLEAGKRTSFGTRKLVEGFDRLPRIATDSARILEEDRR